MQGRLDIGRCFNDAAEVYKEHWVMLVLVNLLFGILTFVTLGILAGPLITGYNLILLELLRKKKERVEIGDLFKFFDKLWPLVGLFFLYALIIFAGLMFLIIPGIIFSVTLMYVFYLAADKNFGFTEAIKKSWNLVLIKGLGINFVLYALSFGIVFAVGMVPLLGSFLGALAGPFASLLIASAYIQQVD